MKRPITTAIAAALALAGCASYEPNEIARRIDPISIKDQTAYQAALQECANLVAAKREQDQWNNVAMALAGGLLGAGVGAAITPGNDGYGARVGAITGSLSAGGASSARSMTEEDAMAANCMANRGYKVLY